MRVFQCMPMAHILEAHEFGLRILQQPLDCLTELRRRDLILAPTQYDSLCLDVSPFRIFTVSQAFAGLCVSLVVLSAEQFSSK